METHRLALPKGYRLANYELTRILGKGGFGITYLGIDRHLGRKVAIKELLPDTIVTRLAGMQVGAHSAELASNWEWAKERFMEEARVLASFQHPNIVEVHQLIEANGTVYMVMDYIEGESYEARLRRIGREPDEHSMRLLLEPLMDGLEEVHLAGLLHRDIKPDNILLRRGIQPILLDFGSARKLLEGTSVMTSLVTHGYSPIEQYQIKGKQGPWTDIYALGAVAVRAMTGEKPPVSADRMSEDDFVWLSYRGLKDFSPLFLQAVDWGLRVNAKERPQNISEWRASFGWASRGNFHSKHPAGPATAATADKTSVARPSDGGATRPAATRTFVAQPVQKIAKQPVTASIEPKLPQVHKKRQWPLAAAILGLVALLIGGAWFLSGRGVAESGGVQSNADTATPTGSLVTPAGSPKAAARDYATFENSLGMKFAPVSGTPLLFCVWDTRVQDYRAFVQATGREWKKPDFSQELNHPAVNVTWDDANAFCAWLTEKEGVLYRLPTDEEWSLAAGLPAEAGETPKEKDASIKDFYPWGTGWPPPQGVGNYARSMSVDDFEKTSPVGAFPENGQGLFDMSGNVWQWCQDWYDGYHRNRVLRGGAWNSCTSVILLSSFRYYANPGDRCDNVGFRCLTTGKKTTAP